MRRLGISGLTPRVLGRLFSAGAAGLRPTHSIPEQGLPIRRQPDPNEKPFGRLPGGQEVHVEIHVGAWARLVGSGGKSLKREEMLPINGRPFGWVDSQRLTDVPSDLLQDCAPTADDHDITPLSASPGLDIDRGTQAPSGPWSAVGSHRPAPKSETSRVGPTPPAARLDPFSGGSRGRRSRET